MAGSNIVAPMKPSRAAQRAALRQINGGPPA
jgi:hypothetical protein